MFEITRIGTSTDVLGEGTVWCPEEQALYWVDIKAPCVRRWLAATGEVTTWSMPESVGSLALRRDGGIIVALRSGISFFDPETGDIEPKGSPCDDGADMRFNDGKCDRQGRFWVGTMADEHHAARGRLYRFDGRGCIAMLDGIDIPNSLCWSPDGSTMYFADSVHKTQWAFPYDPETGEIGERRVFRIVENAGAPDGATVDAEGHVWTAQYHGACVTRSDPVGRVVLTIPLPMTQPTCCAFGGADMTTLFVSSASQSLGPHELAAQPMAGALVSIEVGVRGLPEPRYAG